MRGTVGVRNGTNAIQRNCRLALDCRSIGKLFLFRSWGGGGGGGNGLLAVALCTLALLPKTDDT